MYDDPHFKDEESDNQGGGRYYRDLIPSWSLP